MFSRPVEIEVGYLNALLYAKQKAKGADSRLLQLSEEMIADKLEILGEQFEIVYHSKVPKIQNQLFEKR